jgi:broad-specificity NMP kinase
MVNQCFPQAIIWLVGTEGTGKPLLTKLLDSSNLQISFLQLFEYLLAERCLVVVID